MGEQLIDFQSVLLTDNSFFTFQTKLEISNQCAQWILWEGHSVIFIHWEPPFQDTRKRFLDAVAVYPTVLENYLKLP